jgi:two-component system NtrC family sensor kinase
MAARRGALRCPRRPLPVRHPNRRPSRSPLTRRPGAALLAALGAAIGLLPARAAAQAHEASVVVVGGDHDYPPYEFLDPDGKPSGFNVDLTRAIAEVLGMKVEIRLGEWNDIRDALLRGEIDAVQGVVHSEPRDALFDFSPPHAIVHQSVFGRRGATPVTQLAQLEGKEVIVQRGGIMHDTLRDRQVAAKLVLVDTHAAALRLLASGRGDYALVGNLPGLYFARELGLSNIHAVGKLFGGQPYGYAVRKGNTEVLSQFAEGLAILKNTGRYQGIYDRWLGPLEPAGVSLSRVLKYGAMLAAPLLILLGGAAVWTRTLQKEVANRTEELRLQQQQLIQADKMAALGILVSGVAHEINNPTGLILMNVPVLARAYQAVTASLDERFRAEGDFLIGGLPYSQVREELPRMIQEMGDGANRIKRIVEDLKHFARRDSSALEEAVDLNAVVQAAVRLVDNSIRKATTRFGIAYGEGLPTFRGNSQRIEQVVVNLLLNACQALPDAQRAIQVATAHDPLRGGVVLTVKDEGVGIPAEHLSHLTDPFFTTKREQGGTGLGLSVSAGIVKEHQGRIEFRSAVGEGTTVTVALPAPEVHA